MTKRIVAVRFDDGTEREVDDEDLKRYLADRRYQEFCNHHVTGVRYWELQDLVETAQAVMSEAKSQTNSANASGPRTGITKEQLLKERDQYEFERGTVHGWKAEACRKFGIDTKTLNSILK